MVAERRVQTRVGQHRGGFIIGQCSRGEDSDQGRVAQGRVQTRVGQKTRETLYLGRVAEGRIQTRVGQKRGGFILEYRKRKGIEKVSQGFKGGEGQRMGVEVERVQRRGVEGERVQRRSVEVERVQRRQGVQRMKGDREGRGFRG